MIRVWLSAAAVLMLSGAGPQSNDRQLGVPIGSGTTLAKVDLTSPHGGWMVDRMMLVEGTVSDTTVDPIVLSINGDRYLMRTHNGHFSRKFPTAAGNNVVIALATNKAGTARAEASAYGDVPPVPLKAILTSDTDGVWTDLHIYEPKDESITNGQLDPHKMAHVYWANTASPSGGTFLLNEQGGEFDEAAYGPYLYLHRAPPKGVYCIATNYWPSGDKAHTIATLNVALFEGKPQEVHRRVQVPLATQGTTRVLAWINVLGADEALIYVPGQDPPPTGPDWPTNLQEAADQIVKGVSSPGDFGD